LVLCGEIFIFIKTRFDFLSVRGGLWKSTISTFGSPGAGAEEILQMIRHGFVSPGSPFRSFHLHSMCLSHPSLSNRPEIHFHPGPGE
jgi:hypothetical protein